MEESKINNNNTFSFLGLGMILIIINMILFVFWEYFPPYKILVYLGVLLWILGIAMWITALLAFRKYGGVQKNKLFFTTEKLVDQEIFRFVRHPQYLAYMFLNCGFIFVTGDTWITITSVISGFLIYMGIQEEEEKLYKQFGDAYKDYSEKVPQINLLKSIWEITQKKTGIQN